MTPASRSFLLAGACYGALLHAYPSSYRQRFAGDMRDTFLRDLSEVKARGWLALFAFWIVTIAQALWFGGAERRSQELPCQIRLRRRVSDCRCGPTCATPSACWRVVRYLP